MVVLTAGMVVLTADSSASCTPSPGSGESPVAVSASVSGLSTNTEYHFRISATNSGGTSKGSDATFKTLTAPHYYINGVLAGSEPTTVIAWGTLALRTVVGGSGEVVCHTVRAGTIENPAGGLAVGSTQVFASFDCESTTCAFSSVLAAQSLPWPSVLEAEGSVIRAKTTGVKLTSDCRKEETSEGSETFVGADQPSFRHGTSVLHPGFLEFDPGSGSLEKEGSGGGVQAKGEGESQDPRLRRTGTHQRQVEREGSKGAVQAQIEGDLKVLGYDEQELINVK